MPAPLLLCSAAGLILLMKMSANYGKIFEMLLCYLFAILIGLAIASDPNAQTRYHGITLDLSEFHIVIGGLIALYGAEGLWREMKKEDKE